MPRWQERVDELLYEGESVRETLELESASVVVTSHRVLAFTPELDGENFQQVDRPNVAGVDTDARANDALLSRAISIGTVGVLLVAVGYVVDFDSLLGDTDLASGQASGELGLGGVIETTQRLLDVFAQLDEFMRLFGALALLGAVGLFGIYWLRRDPTLVINTAGEDDDIRVPRPENVDDARARLEDALFPDDIDRPQSGDRLRDSLLRNR